MSAGTLPTATIVIVNYNGKQYLENCLSSIQRVDYPRDRLETILVDNASSDGSVEFVANRFPWVRIIQNNTNLGFARGNNAALSLVKTDYVALLNNDTKVDPNWLKELVLAAEADPDVGACTPKILFYRDRLVLDVRCATFRPSELFSTPDNRELGVTVSNVEVEGLQPGQGVHFLEGFYGSENLGNRSFRWTGKAARLAVEVPDGVSKVNVHLELGLAMPEALPPVPVQVMVGGEEIAAFNVDHTSCHHPYVIRVPVSTSEVARSIIQNAGGKLLTDGSGRDRGDCSIAGRQLHEEDCGQYDRVEEVFSFCGASVLLRMAMLSDIGLFDDWFFAYYEDTDLAWRARLRGWKILYVPTSVVRHIHCGTSVEWSPFFVFRVERNRLCMLLKNAPAHFAAKWFLKYLRDTLSLWRGMLESCVRLDLAGARAVKGQALLKAQVVSSIMLRLPILLWQRFTIRRRMVVSDGEIMGWVVDE